MHSAVAAAAAAAATGTGATAATPVVAAPRIGLLTAAQCASAAECFAETFARENQTIAVGEVYSGSLAFARGYFPEFALPYALTFVATAPARAAAAAPAPTPAPTPRATEAAPVTAAAAATATAPATAEVVGFASAFDLPLFYAHNSAELAATASDPPVSHAIDEFVGVCLDAFAAHFAAKTKSQVTANCVSDSAAAAPAAATAAAAAAADSKAPAQSQAATAAVANAKAMATGAAALPARTYVFIDLIGVRERFGGRGVANALVQRVEEHARAQGYAYAVSIGSGVFSQKLFAKRGFAQVWRQSYADVQYRHPVTGAVTRPFASITDADCVVFVKPLTPPPAAPAATATAAIALPAAAP